MEELPNIFTSEEFDSSFDEEVNHEKETFCSPTKKYTLDEAFCIVDDNFPRIYEHIKWVWGSKECADYLYRLIASPDRQDRCGFPQKVFDALLIIHNTHEDKFKFYREEMNYR